MEKRVVLDFLTKAGLIACAAFVVCCVLVLVAVINDLEWLEVVVALCMAASLVFMVVGFFSALFNRKWLMAASVLGSSFLALVIGFLAVVMIGVGQHHPPRQAEEAAFEDTTDVNIQSFVLD